MKQIITKLKVKDSDIRVLRVNNQDYISLTDLASYKNSENPANVIIHWLSNKSSFDFVGLWEELNNPNFNFTEYREIKINESGLQSFTMSPSRWVKRTNAIGIVSKGGKYSVGTFAHSDIALEFASWIDTSFKLYLIKEFQRLKFNEAYQNKIEWNVRRSLSKTNYKLHTYAIKENIVPILTDYQKQYIYQDEADVLNIALFGETAKEWKDKNPNLSGNRREYEDILHLIVLANLEILNSEMIEQNLSQKERLIRLNNIAKKQLEVLRNDNNILKIERIDNKLNLEGKR